MATVSAAEVEKPISELQSASERAEHVTLIRPRKGLQWLDFAELWRYRDLLGILAMRDIQIRYKQTALGALWAIIRPFIKIFVFTVFFGSALGVADKVNDAMAVNVAYPIFLFSGLLLWEFISSSVGDASMSLIGNANIITKIYLPRIFIPTAAMGAPALDFLISCGMLFLLMLGYGETFRWTLALVPLCFLGAIVGTLGISLILASISVTYRDVKHVIPFFVQVWFFVTPVIFPVEILSNANWAKWLLALNPATGPINAVRWCIIGTPLDLPSFFVSVASGVICLIVGIALFCSVERRFADIA